MRRSSFIQHWEISIFDAHWLMSSLSNIETALIPKHKQERSIDSKRQIMTPFLRILASFIRQLQASANLLQTFVSFWASLVHSQLFSIHSSSFLLYKGQKLHILYFCLIISPASSAKYLKTKLASEILLSREKLNLCKYRAIVLTWWTAHRC